MAQADSNNSTRAPIDSTRRGFLSQAAGAVAGGTVMALATFPPVGATAAPASPLDPAFALITQHRAAQQAYRDVLIAQAELHNAAPEEILRLPRVQWGTKDGEPYYLHSHKEIDHRLEWAPDFGRTPEIRARLHAELTRDIRDISAKRTEHGLTAADDRAEELWESCLELDWTMATTVPTSLAGVAAMLRYANEFEDSGSEWPGTDTIGREGWHYQLRQSAARALEGLLS